MSKEIVAILCSGVALGVYIPALIVNRRLQLQDVSTEIFVLENLLQYDKRNKIPKSKIAFHRSFAVALTGQKIAKNITPHFDTSIVSEIISTWKKNALTKFIVFSGYWIPILEDYKRQSDLTDISFQICHLDADISVSFKPYKPDKFCFKQVYFFSWEEKKISFFLKINNNNIVPFLSRNERFVIHGGGWGMGTYKDKIELLGEKKISLDVICYEYNDIKNRIENNRYFMIDPDWKPWEKNNNGNYSFPPFGTVKDNDTIEFDINDDFSEVYTLISQSRAIISKPGGATLLDSFSSATPVILLEPFGEYENKNALLWKHLGFGISWQEWMDSGFSITLLEKLHNNLLIARDNIKDYVEWYYATSNINKNR